MEDFYKEKTWELIQNDIKEIRCDLKKHQVEEAQFHENQRKGIEEINKKLNQMTGWALGAGAAAGFIISFVKDKWLK